MSRSIIKPALLAAATLSLGGCTMYGIDGYGSAYADPYYDPYYGQSYYGWYDDYYYPGVGIYIYDTYGTRSRWNDGHRRYWERRRGKHHGQANWDGYRRGNDGRYGDRNRGDRRADTDNRGRRDQDGNYRDQRRGDRDGNYRDQREGTTRYGDKVRRRANEERQDDRSGNNDRRGRPDAAVSTRPTGRPMMRDNAAAPAQATPRRQPPVIPQVNSAPRQPAANAPTVRRPVTIPPTINQSRPAQTTRSDTSATRAQDAPAARAERLENARKNNRPVKVDD